MDDLVDGGMATYFDDAEQLAGLVADKKAENGLRPLLENKVFLAGSTKNIKQALETIQVDGR